MNTVINADYTAHQVQQNPVLCKRLAHDAYPKRICICPGCNEVNYKGVWYVPDSRLTELINVEKDEVTARYCPACSMKNAGMYEGELNIYRVPPHLKERVELVVLQEVASIMAQNPQHRLLSMSDHNDHYQLTATAGPMVRKLGEKIQNSFWTCDVESKYFTKPNFLQQVNASFKTAEYF